MSLQAAMVAEVDMGMGAASEEEEEEGADTTTVAHLLLAALAGVVLDTRKIPLRQTLPGSKKWTLCFRARTPASILTPTRTSRCAPHMCYVEPLWCKHQVSPAMRPAPVLNAFRLSAVTII